MREENKEYICDVKLLDGVVALSRPKEELIRCKDCKYHEIFFGYTNGWCNYGNGHILATIDDYCSHAERKEE